MDARIRRPALGVITMITIAAAVILLVGALSTQATPTEAATGGINVDGYCKTNYPPSLYVRSFAKISGGWNVWGWRCHVGWTNIDIYSVDMNKACRQQYRSGAYAKYRNVSDPYSWYCVY